MANLPKNLIIVKNAVLLNKRRVQAREWLKYFKKNWNELTQNLRNATILILAGRHGNEDGTIGPVEEALMYNHERLVRTYTKSLYHIFKGTYFGIFRLSF